MARRVGLVYHSPLTQDACVLVSEPPLGLCARHMPRAATPDNARNSLHRKPLRTSGSAEGRPRVNGVVRTGSQVPADWHVQLRHDPCLENREKRSTSAPPSTATRVRQLPVAALVRHIHECGMPADVSRARRTADRRRLRALQVRESAPSAASYRRRSGGQGPLRHGWRSPLPGVVRGRRTSPLPRC
jgi:hypothetical protein